MRRVSITLAVASAMLIAALPTWQANAQIERGAAGFCETAKNFTPVEIEKAACGPHWGAHCGPWHHWHCGPHGHCWCVPC